MDCFTIYAPCYRARMGGSYRLVDRGPLIAELDRQIRRTIIESHPCGSIEAFDKKHKNNVKY